MDYFADAPGETPKTGGHVEQVAEQAARRQRQQPECHGNRCVVLADGPRGPHEGPGHHDHVVVGHLRRGGGGGEEILCFGI